MRLGPQTDVSQAEGSSAVALLQVSLGFSSTLPGFHNRGAAFKAP